MPKFNYVASHIVVSLRQKLFKPLFITFPSKHKSPAELNVCLKLARDLLNKFC